MPLTVQEGKDIVNLFGTISNAMCRLGLQHLDYQKVRRVLIGQVRHGDVSEDVQESWRTWQRQYFLVHVVPRPSGWKDFELIEGAAGEKLEDELCARARGKKAYKTA